MTEWQSIETAPKDMRRIPGGGRPVEFYAQLDGYGDEWAIVEWDDETSRWVTHATDEPLVYGNEPHARKWWRPLRDLPNDRH